MLKNFAKAKSLRFMPAAVANGIGQVMFQPCILTGLLFLVGIFIGSIECGMPRHTYRVCVPDVFRSQRVYVGRIDILFNFIASITERIKQRDVGM